MGCEASSISSKSQVNIEELFYQFGLQRLFTPICFFDNELERQIFMAINVCRFNPATFAQVVQSVRASNQLCQQARNTDQLIQFLSKNEQIPEVVYDVAAFDACRQNNRIQCNPMIQVPPFGGNITTLQNLVGSKIPAEECTLFRFQQNSGAEFVALEMILDFDRFGATPVLKPDVTRVGISNMSNRNCINLIQVLYVMIPMKPPTVPYQQPSMQQPSVQQQNMYPIDNSIPQPQVNTQLDANGQPIISAPPNGQPVNQPNSQQPQTTTTTTVIYQQPNPYAQYGYGYEYPPPRSGMGAGGAMMAGMMMGTMMAMDMEMMHDMNNSHNNSGRHVTVVNDNHNHGRGGSSVHSYGGHNNNNQHRAGGSQPSHAGHRGHGHGGGHRR